MNFRLVGASFCYQNYREISKMPNNFTAKLVLGVTVGVLVNVFFAVCYFRKKKKTKQKEETNQGKNILNCELATNADFTVIMKYIQVKFAQLSILKG